MTINRKQAVRWMMTAAATLVLAGGAAVAARQDEHSTNRFAGPKANTGTAIHYRAGNNSMLRVSDDFKVPETPAPTWRIVDSKGNIYTLDAFKIKGGEKREVMVPRYVRDIAKVQVYCAFAEVLLGEASFASPVN